MVDSNYNMVTYSQKTRLEAVNAYIYFAVKICPERIFKFFLNNFQVQVVCQKVNAFFSILSIPLIVQIQTCNFVQYTNCL